MQNLFLNSLNLMALTLELGNERTSKTKGNEPKTSIAASRKVADDVPKTCTVPPQMADDGAKRRALSALRVIPDNVWIHLDCVFYHFQCYQ